MKVKTTRQFNGRPDTRATHNGERIARWESMDYTYPSKKLGKPKVKHLINNTKNVNDQSAVMYPDDYIEKMHVSKSNWLSRLERGRER